LKLSRSTVKRAITDLEKSRIIRKEQMWRENGGKSSNLFYLTFVDTVDSIKDDLPAKGIVYLHVELWHGSW
jgi:predicted transcriptional regulator